MKKKKLNDVGEGLQALSQVEVQPEKDPLDEVLGMTLSVDQDKALEESRVRMEKLQMAREKCQGALRTLDWFQTLTPAGRLNQQNVQEREIALRILETCKAAPDALLRCEHNLAVIRHRLSLANGSVTRQEVLSRLNQLVKEEYLVPDKRGDLRLAGERYIVPPANFPVDVTAGQRKEVADLFSGLHHRLSGDEKQTRQNQWQAAGYGRISLDEFFGKTKGFSHLAVPYIPAPEQREEEIWSVAGPPGVIAPLSDGHLVVLGAVIAGDTLAGQLRPAIDNQTLALPFGSWDEERPPQLGQYVSKPEFAAYCTYWNAMKRAATMYRERKEMISQSTVNSTKFLLPKPPRPIGQSFLFHSDQKTRVFVDPETGQEIRNLFFLAERRDEGDEQEVGLAAVPTHLKPYLGEFVGQWYPGDFTRMPTPLGQIFSSLYRQTGEDAKQHQADLAKKKAVAADNSSGSEQ